MLHLLTIIACSRFQFFHFWLKLFHLRHRDVRFIGQREQNSFDNQGKANDGPAHVTDQFVDLVKQPEDWFGQKEEPAPVDTIDEFGNTVGLVFPNSFPFFRARKQTNRVGR